MSTFVLSPSSSVSPLSPTHPYSSFHCCLLFHHNLSNIHIHPLSVAFFFTPISDKSTLSFLYLLLFHPHLRHIHIHPFSVAFGFTPISDTSILILSLSSSVSQPSPTHPHSSFLSRLLFHPHLRHIHIHPISVVFCFTPISDTSTFILYLSSSVSQPSPTHPHPSFLSRLLFHPHLRHIHIHPISVVFCFTAISDTSTFILSLSSSISPPSPTHPHSSFLCRLLFHPQLRLIHIDSISYIFCFTPVSATSIFIRSLSSSVSSLYPTHPYSSVLFRLPFHP